MEEILSKSGAIESGGENNQDILVQIKELVEQAEDEQRREKVLSSLEKEYQDVRKQFEDSHPAEAAQLASKLLQRIIAGIVRSHYMELNVHDKFKSTWDKLSEGAKSVVGKSKEKEITELMNWPLNDLCSLLEVPDFWRMLKGSYEEHAALLNSFNWEQIAELCEICKQGKQERPTLALLGVQQILCAIASLMLVHENIEITEYYLLANFTHMTDEIQKIRDSHTKLTEVESRLSYLRSKSSDVGIRPFRWIKFRGMLINTSDGSRNISFKVETLVNIFSSIHSGITRWCLPSTSTGADVHKLARHILFESGYHSGSKFGWTMHEIFQKDRRNLKIADKINLWCEFDSDVGFGMLSLGKLEQKESTVQRSHYIMYSIDIELSYNFLAYRRESTDVNLCSFMCGYIQGVLEKITGQPLFVTHTAHECEQYIAELDHCTYHASTNKEKLELDLEKAEKNFSNQLILSDTEQ